MATLLGGALGLGMHDLASLTEQKIEIVLLGASVFIIGELIIVQKQINGEIIFELM